MTFWRHSHSYLYHFTNARNRKLENLVADRNWKEKNLWKPRWRNSIWDVHGVPKKTVISVQTVIEGIRNELGIKVGGVSENSGYFLSNEYKNSTISRKKSWEKRGQTWLPPLEKISIFRAPCRFLRNSMNYGSINVSNNLPNQCRHNAQNKYKTI